MNEKKEYSREELVDYLRQLKEELGKVPTKKDIPPDIKPQIRNAFGKWCYALEESDLVTPSEKVLERRKRRREKWNKVHRTRSERRRNSKE